MLLGENVDLFSVPLPSSLKNKTLAESGIGSRTGLSVVAVQQDGRLITSLHASMRLEAGAQLIMLGGVQQRRAFTDAFG